MNHVNSWKPHSPLHKWWNLGAIGLHLQINPLIKGSGDLYLQDHIHVYIFCMFFVSNPKRHAFLIPCKGPLKYLLAIEVHIT
jgi:hypothetical protein